MKSWSQRSTPEMVEYARRMAAPLLRAIFERGLHEKCRVVYLVSEVTWPVFHQQFEGHNLTVFWKQKVAPRVAHDFLIFFGHILRPMQPRPVTLWPMQLWPI